MWIRDRYGTSLSGALPEIVGQLKALTYLCVLPLSSLAMRGQGRSCTVGLAADSVRESLIRRVLGGTGIPIMFGTSCIQLLLDFVSLLNMSGDLRVLTATSLPSGHTPVLASPCISHATATHTASHHTHCRTSDLQAEYICYGAVC